ncbi:hypothetical protein BGW36DRAFT_397279 [Talaromyces proteolyticus]|uniref:3-keto-steroid reductase n=1 Tax=Talaromyces proteolyticus TaxID=1131652 RepID=A0AAD4KRF4_9EURO|nr:uncharacterized protein BGW36DRAFT_397279 [Talaromyces proteolyticus]KAH8697609.1 hypothetical protein BGW36DRAFT_397279 [Talaromyces proteolyticus]
MPPKNALPPGNEARLQINPPDKLDDHTVVLITGANTGLGYSDCCRLIDEFAQNFSAKHKLTIIFTTRRPPAKVTETRNGLLKYASRHGNPVASRITVLAETLDLCDLWSVRALSRRLNRNFPKLDAIILNAGAGGWLGLNWPKTLYNVFTDFVHALTWPNFKLGSVGVTVPRHTNLPEETPLGLVFCGNVFGHYMLAHNLMPLLRRSGRPNGPGRVIWTGSIEATINFFDVEDIQALKRDVAYESSKTLTDLLALTSDLPSTAPWVNSYLADDSQPSSKSTTATELVNSPAPIIYVSHPGIFGSSVVPLILPLWYCMLAAMYIARFIGSPWHTVSTYLGAIAPVWLALSPQEVLDEAEKPYRENGGGYVKWGSSTDRLGNPLVACTEIDGWGFGGVIGTGVLPEDRARRRKRGMKYTTAEDRVRFEELGRRSWQQMEELRVHWEKLLDAAEESE